MRHMWLGLVPTRASTWVTMITLQFLHIGFHQYCNLKRHYASHAAGPGAGFQCLHCPASFSTKSVLSVHMREAHGDKYPTKKFLASANKQQQMQQKAGQSQQQNATNGATHAIAADNATSAGVKRLETFNHFIHLNDIIPTCFINIYLA